MKSVWPEVNAPHPYGSSRSGWITWQLLDEILDGEGLRTEVSVDNATNIITGDLLELLDSDS